jgi:hypothetical protein
MKVVPDAVLESVLNATLDSEEDRHCLHLKYLNQMRRVHQSTLTLLAYIHAYYFLQR